MAEPEKQLIFKTTDQAQIEIGNLPYATNTKLVCGLLITTQNNPDEPLNLHLHDSRPMGNGLACKLEAGNDEAHWDIYICLEDERENPFINGKLTVAQVKGKPTPINLRFQVSLKSDNPADVEKMPRFLVPGVLYRENCPEGCTRIYPKYSPTQTDIENFISPVWSFPADRTPTPAVFCWHNNLTAGLAPL